MGSEAAFYGDSYGIAPLPPTLAELLAELDTHRLLVARCGGNLRLYRRLGYTEVVSALTSLVYLEKHR